MDYPVVINTPRYVFRDFEAADYAPFRAYHADSRYRALYGPDESAPDHADRLLEMFRAWAAERPRLNYQFAVSSRGEGSGLVGCAGLRQKGHEHGTAELGIELAPGYWGRYRTAIEIASGLLEFGFSTLGLAEIVGSTTSANLRAARLAAWFGGVLVESAPGAEWMQERGWAETRWRVAREALQRSAKRP